MVQTIQRRVTAYLKVFLLLSALWIFLPLVSATSHATDEDVGTRAPGAWAGAWGGIWNAEDTLFTIRVVRQQDEFVVEPVESLGLIWVTRKGTINGDSATIEVEYQGVIGKILVQLLDANTAVARAMSCQPDYHVICALVKNQQARFLKTELVSD